MEAGVACSSHSASGGAELLRKGRASPSCLMCATSCGVADPGRRALRREVSGSLQHVPAARP